MCGRLLVKQNEMLHTQLKKTVLNSNFIIQELSLGAT